MCHHSQPIDDITATIWKVLHAVYLWYHIPYVFDKISTKYDITTLCVYVTTLGICMTSFALQMTSHPFYHTKQQYLWCHIHFRHDITPHVWDSAPTVSLSSQLLHWYHTHFWTTSHHILCDIICTITNPYIFTLLYLWHHNLYIWYHIQYVGQHTHYTSDITATIWVLTPTV